MLRGNLDLTQGNLYTTTLIAINSSIIKLSHLSAAVKIYRGISGGVLPSAFWSANEFKVKGAVDTAFISTTTNREVAMQYAATSGFGICFEMEQAYNVSCVRCRLYTVY